jgi:branched-chain amino acid transport system permease protein
MRRLAPWIVLGATIALALVPVFGSVFRVEQLTRILLYMILAASLDLLAGYAGMVSLGHSAFFALSAYTGALLADKFNVSNVLIALPASLIVAAGVSLTAGVLTVRLRGIYFIMATLAFTQIVYFLLNDNPWTGGSDGVLVTADIKAEMLGKMLLNLSDARERFYFTLCVTALVLISLLRIVDSPFGRVLQGIRQNEQRMRSLGYRVRRFKLAAFVISGTLSGLAGYLYFMLTAFADPTLAFWLQSAQILVMTVLGGLGTLIGPAAGAAALTLFVDWCSELTEHWKLYLGILIVAFTLFSTGGIFAALGRIGSLAGLKRAEHRNA